MFATPAPASLADVAVDVRTRAQATVSGFTNVPAIPAGSVLPVDRANDDTALSLALARMLLVAEDASPVPPATVEGAPPAIITTTTDDGTLPVDVHTMEGDSTPQAAWTAEQVVEIDLSPVGTPPVLVTTVAPVACPAGVAEEDPRHSIEVVMHKESIGTTYGARPSPLVPSFPKTYSRRPKQRPTMEADQVADMVPASSPSTPSSCKQTHYMAKMKKKTCKILPTPQANTLRSRVRTPAAPHPPRRSRRIAGVEPELPTGGATSKYKKKVMIALDIIGETEGIDEQSLDEYSKLFS